MKIKSAIAGSILVLGITSAPFAFGQAYTFTDVGALGNKGSSFAYGINNLGEIVGTSLSSDFGNAFAAFYWSQSSGIISLSTPVQTLTQTQAIDINDNGKIVGYASTVNNTQGGSIIWDIRSNTAKLLENNFALAVAINNNDQAVGQTLNQNLNNGNVQSTQWDTQTNTATVLGSLPNGTDSFARAINNSGVVVGTSNTPSALHATLWSNGSVTDLGSLGGDSYAYSVNEFNQVVGHSYLNSGAAHATIWNNGTITDLGTLGGYQSAALSINNLGQVVGESSTRNSFTHATVWHGGVIHDLNALVHSSADGWVLNTAYDINDLGQIVGIARNNDLNLTHAFLLNWCETCTPVTAPVPEPETYAMLLAGLGLLGLMTRRRKQKLDA